MFSHFALLILNVSCKLLRIELYSCLKLLFHSPYRGTVYVFCLFNGTPMFMEYLKFIVNDSFQSLLIKSLTFFLTWDLVLLMEIHLILYFPCCRVGTISMLLLFVCLVSLFKFEMTYDFTFFFIILLLLLLLLLLLYYYYLYL